MRAPAHAFGDGSRLQDYTNTRLQDWKTATLQDYTTKRLQDWKTARLLHYKTLHLRAHAARDGAREDVGKNVHEMSKVLSVGGVASRVASCGRTRETSGAVHGQ